MSMWDSKTVRDVSQVDLRGGRLVRLELLAEGACLHAEGLQVRYQDSAGTGYALFRQDARLLVFGVSEAILSGTLTGEDSIAGATMSDEDGDEIPWHGALYGAPAACLELKLASGAAISLRCSRATLGLEGEGTLVEGWLKPPRAISPNGSRVGTSLVRTPHSRTSSPAPKTEPLALPSRQAG